MNKIKEGERMKREGKRVRRVEREIPERNQIKEKESNLKKKDDERITDDDDDDE